MREGRTPRLKQRLLEAPFEVCAERAVLWTEAQRRTQGQPQVVRNARALEHLLTNMSIRIAPEELIVGNRTSKTRGAPLFPETKSFSIAAQLESYESRAIQPYRVGEAEKRALREILPYWQGRSAWDRAFALMPPDVQADVFKFIFTVEAEFANGIGHFIVGNGNLLAKGLAGIRAEAEGKLRAGSGANHDRRRDFWSAAVIAANAAIAFAGRFAAEARRLAASESDPKRQAEFNEIAEVCDRVPADPPRTFREAIQAVWFNQLICQLECGGFAISPGRLDQLLYPFYRRDRAEGRITPAPAQELIECLYIKMSEVVNVLDTVVLPVTSGPPIAQSLTIAGIDRDGHDATQELSYLFLDAFDSIRTVSPNLAVRFHPQTPADFLRRVGDAVRRGAMMALFNDQVIVPALMQKGIPEPEARDYAIVGCVEPAAAGRTFGSTDANLVNLARCLELALHNGNGLDLVAHRRELASRLNSYFRARKNIGAIDFRGASDCSPPFASERRVGSRRAVRAHQIMLLKYLILMRRRTRVGLADLYRILRGRRLGPASGDAKSFPSFDHVLAAFREQVAFAVDRMVAAMHYCDQAHAELKPTPFLSSTIDDCLAQGRDVTEGGARYNFTGPQAVGLADVADSLAAIQKLVFERKKVSMAQLLAALDRNFEAGEPLRQMLLHQAPKFGNDEEEVDALARKAAAIYCQEVSRHKNFRGGPYSPGIYSMSAHIVFGILTGATPDGRKAWESLAAGVSPARGREQKGPTAVLRSAAQVDGTLLSNGCVLNMSMDPKLIQGEKNLEKFAALNRAYFDLGGLHVQYNIVDTETLKEAQRDPERHRGLVVRVAGYSALFTELDRATQDDIITRTRYGVRS
jgi:formate C-acetyltransferase